MLISGDKFVNVIAVGSISSDGQPAMMMVMTDLVACGVLLD